MCATLQAVPDAEVIIQRIKDEKAKEAQRPGAKRYI